MEPTVYDTLVLTKDQLTGHNMSELSRGGWTVANDPRLIIFVRPSGKTQIPEDSQVIEDIPEEPVPITRTERRATNHRKA